MAKETLAFGAEIEKILHLMIYSLYENREIFLRELISNSSDACDKLRYQAVTDPDLLSDGAKLKIKISFDKKAGTLTVSDNGIGMSKDEMIKNLGTIAKSGTQEFLQKLSGNSKKDVNLIGQFGVGFYSSFMVADKVTVVSKKAGKKKTNVWESEGKGKFTIGESAEEIASHGTEITLHMREDAKEYLDKWRLSHIVKTYSDHVAFPIEIIDEEGKSEIANSASALWLRPKSEITPEQYKEFYHHVGQSHDEPWMTLHNKAEGKIEYTNLLFIPTRKPFDLFHPDRMRRVKLYVKRVFITDENVEIIPPYLRFLRGVVDSEDLPLNISRETLQDNPLLGKIRTSITKKVMEELKKKAEKEPEEFKKFWDNFGPVIKEGLCDALEPRENLLEVCRFYTTSSGGKLTSLKEYKQRMKPGQGAIYYITGDSLEALGRSPQIEGFVAKGIEVVLLHDTVDDFWVNVVHEFDGTEMKSVTRVSDEIEKIESEKNNKEGSAKTAAADKKIGQLIEFMKKLLGEQVKDVRVSTKLTKSPVCLAVQEGGMDMRMERFLVDNKQLPGKMSKILEINPSHKIIKSLAADLESSGSDKKKIEDVAYLLFCQANIIEGESLADVREFSEKMNKVLENALAA